MRFARRLAVLPLLVALTASCDSTQPLQLEEQTAQLSFKAVGALTQTFEVWDVFEDNDGDELPDDGQTYVWCENSFATLPPSTVAWNFSVDVQILRAGETVPENVTSDEARSSKGNVAAYDTAAPFLGATQQKSDICTSGGDQAACPPGSQPPAGGSRYRFRNPRRQNGANVALAFAEASPLFNEIFDDTTVERGLGQGLCSVGNSGPANIDGGPQPLEIVINKGDTVIVKARLANVAPSMSGLNELIGAGGIPPTSLSGTMTLDGRPITLNGTSSGDAISFSYTSR